MSRLIWRVHSGSREEWLSRGETMARAVLFAFSLYYVVFNIQRGPLAGDAHREMISMPPHSC